MDISQLPQSKRVEDERTGAIGELVNQLLHPFKDAYKGLVEHPFQTNSQYYNDLYAKMGQTPSEEEYNLMNSPLASDIGMGATLKRPMPDPAHIQALLQQLSPPMPGDQPRRDPARDLGNIFNPYYNNP